ncbi:hypothetical protein CBR_g30235 [Chara braunii]|uniref:Uncharacterized protein n=1 Tax=Chara braunii TaxID=69332 RepID=A0A388LCP7_CHABU|nr:hypothetical protein CBR_g30235 [Chara braunii]|eukprot:GBG79973.1 hypothetical protein CBR_g30235 [Chara braunii]
MSPPAARGRGRRTSSDDRGGTSSRGTSPRVSGRGLSRGRGGTLKIWGINVPYSDKLKNWKHQKPMMKLILVGVLIVAIALILNLWYFYFGRKGFVWRGKKSGWY